MALNTLAELSFNNLAGLPPTEDLITLRRYLEKEMKMCCQDLKSRPTLVTWRMLAELTVTRIILFNKRRCSEGAKMKVKQFEERPKWNKAQLQEITQTLTSLEQQLCNRYVEYIFFPHFAEGSC